MKRGKYGIPHVLTLFIKHKNKGNTKLHCVCALVFIVSLHKSASCRNCFTSLVLFITLRALVIHGYFVCKPYFRGLNTAYIHRHFLFGSPLSRFGLRLCHAFCKVNFAVFFRSSKHIFFLSMEYKKSRHSLVLSTKKMLVNLCFFCTQHRSLRLSSPEASGLKTSATSTLTPFACVRSCVLPLLFRKLHSRDTLRLSDVFFLRLAQVGCSAGSCRGRLFVNVE